MLSGSKELPFLFLHGFAPGSHRDLRVINTSRGGHPETQEPRRRHGSGKNTQ